MLSREWRCRIRRLAGAAWLHLSLTACSPATVTADTAAGQDGGRPNATETGEGLALECGNGLRQPGEACDELDEVWGDGCNPDCTLGGQTLWLRSIEDPYLFAQQPRVGHFDGGIVLAWTASAPEIDAEVVNVVALGDQGEELWRKTLSESGHIMRVVDLEAGWGHCVLAVRDTTAAQVQLLSFSPSGKKEWTHTVPWSGFAEPKLGMSLSSEGFAMVSDVMTDEMGEPASLTVVQRFDPDTGELEASATLDNSSSISSLRHVAKLREDGTMWAMGPIGNSGERVVFRWEPGAQPRQWRRELGLAPHGIWIDDDGVGILSDFDGFQGTRARHYSFDAALHDDTLLVSSDPFEGPGGDFHQTVQWSPRGDFLAIDSSGVVVHRNRRDGVSSWRSLVDGGSVRPEALTELPDGRVVVVGLSPQPWVAELAP